MTIKGFLTIPLIFLLSFGLSGCSSIQQDANGQSVNSGSFHMHSMTSQ